MEVNRYRFDKIVAETKKMISPIRRGEEDGIYFEYLALLEMKMYDFHKRHGINGRQAKEILQLILFDIKSIVDEIDYNCTALEESCYRDCTEEIEQLFLPEKNPGLKDALIKETYKDDAYFEFARKNIVRIHESVEQWTKDFGSNGYFTFIGDYIGTEIESTKKYLVEDRYLRP